jgi:hypothetical protein
VGGRGGLGEIVECVPLYMVLCFVHKLATNCSVALSTYRCGGIAIRRELIQPINMVRRCFRSPQGFGMRWKIVRCGNVSGSGIVPRVHTALCRQRSDRWLAGRSAIVGIKFKLSDRFDNSRNQRTKPMKYAESGLPMLEFMV